MDETAGGEPPVTKLRHEAGLTAGQTLPLSSGRFRFGPLRSNEGGLVSGTPEVVSFDLSIQDDGSALLSAGREPVAVEGVIIDGPVALEDGDVVQLTTDHFVLETAASTNGRRHHQTVEPRPIHRMASPSMTKWLALFGTITLLGAAAGVVDGRLFGFALLGLAGIVATLMVRSRRRQLASEAHRVAVDNARSLFFSEIVAARKNAAEKLRLATNTPATIARRADDRSSSPSQGQHVLATIASGDRGWEPPVVVHRDPGWDHTAIVEELSFLPAIPFTVDLDVGPLAVVGPRPATLAVARHLVTTTMCVEGGGATISTDVPADWRWLHAAERSSIRVLDHVGGDLGPRTVVLADSIESLRTRFAVDNTDPVDIAHDATDDGRRVHLSHVDFSHVMVIDDEGRATITTADGGGGSGFVPHGITAHHADDVQQLLAEPKHAIELGDEGDILDPVRTDQRCLVEPTVDRSAMLDLAVFDTDRLLVTGTNHSKNRDVLATAAIRQAGMHPGRALYILDRGDRALIRLAQLESCASYVTIDQVDGVDQLIWDLAAATADPDSESGLLLAPDLWTTIAFYRATGHEHLADRIDAVVAKMQQVPLAASSTMLAESPSASFLVWIETSIEDLVEVRQRGGNGVLDMRDLPGIDLTGSVARLKNTPTQEIRP